MRFAFTDDQRMFGESVRALLEKEPDGWRAVLDLGLADLDPVELMLPLEETGRACCSGPLVETALVLGDGRVAAAGFGGYVSHAADADVLLLRHEDELHVVPREAVALRAVEAVDASRPLSGVTWTPAAVTRAGGADALAAAFDRGALGTSAQLLGITARLIDEGASYAKERVQFGKPIGSFQAVKHLLADALVRLEFARPVVYRAAWSVASDDPARSLHVSMAKVFASEAATHACRTSLQVHGAIGYTEEHHLHRWLRRGWTLSSAWGDAAFHRTCVAGFLS